MIKTNLCGNGISLSEDKYVVDPDIGNSLEQYVAWFPKEESILALTNLTYSLTFEKT